METWDIWEHDYITFLTRIPDKAGSELSNTTCVTNDLHYARPSYTKNKWASTSLSRPTNIPLKHENTNRSVNPLPLYRNSGTVFSGVLKNRWTVMDACDKKQCNVYCQGSSTVNQTQLFLFLLYQHPVPKPNKSPMYNSDWLTKGRRRRKECEDVIALDLL